MRFFLDLVQGCLFSAPDRKLRVIYYLLLLRGVERIYEGFSTVSSRLTPVLFLLVSSKETVKVAAKLGELRTSLRASQHSPKNLKKPVGTKRELLTQNFT